jgi:hypothetical protein
MRTMKRCAENWARIHLLWRMPGSCTTRQSRRRSPAPRTMEQLEGSTRALEIGLSDDVLARLDEIWPGPGGEAPEAYAW